jgi:hypothetical protein
MASVLPITVQDLSKIRNMAMPTPRGPRPPAASKLAPLELSQPSVSFGGPKAAPAPAASAAPGGEPAPAVAHGWLVPAGYVTCGLSMSLCNLFAPWACREFAHVLCPIWTGTLLLHAAAQEPVWRWCGLLVALFLPFVLLLGDALFVAVYLAAFSLFAVSDCWSVIHGPAFIVACACACAGVASACLSTVADHPRVQLSIGGFCAIVSAIVCTTRLARTAYRVG